MGLALRTMEVTDLGFAGSLSVLVGWNQTARDWERLLAVEPEGCFIAEWDGKRAGTATTTCYGTDLAWIGMILVHPDFRRHGIGRSLMGHCLDFLKGRAIRCVKLDATPLGKTLYDQLGFRDEWTLARWEAEKLQILATAHSGPIRPIREADCPRIFDLDARAFGVSRRKLIGQLARQGQGLVMESGGRLEGYGMMRSGMRADYLGPVVASSPEAGIALSRALLSGACGKPIFWDIPDQAKEAVALAQTLGFIQQRQLIRMHRGENLDPGEPHLQFAIADPATG